MKNVYKEKFCVAILGSVSFSFSFPGVQTAGRVACVITLKNRRKLRFTAVVLCPAWMAWCGACLSMALLNSLDWHSRTQVQVARTRLCRIMLASALHPLFSLWCHCYICSESIYLTVIVCMWSVFKWNNGQRSGNRDVHNTVVDTNRCKRRAARLVN